MNSSLTGDIKTKRRTMLPVLYKYLDIKGGMSMIGMGERCEHPTLQFTNATQLNDPFDCHPKLIDYSNVPKCVINEDPPSKWWMDKEENDALNLRKGTWLCSLSKVNNSLLMWSHYCRNHSGVCLGMDLEAVRECVTIKGYRKIYVDPLMFEVQYRDILTRIDAYYSEEPYWYYLWRTKAKEWEYEQEVRFIVLNQNHKYVAHTPYLIEQIRSGRKMFDWKEIHHYRPLKGNCFESIYFGVNTNPDDKEKIIKHMHNLNPNIKLFQMRVDENAFRLKVEKII